MGSPSRRKSRKKSKRRKPQVTWINKDERKKPKKKKVCIPKIIMQTWKTKTVPEKWKHSPISIKKKMPDWEYVLMTDEDNENFVKKNFPWFWPTFRDFEYNIQRADAIRYMWLYVYGGVYMDLDMILQKPLDDLFYTDNEIFLVCSGNIGGVITNSFMASKPKCKVWLHMLEHMTQKLPWWCVGKHLKVMYSTGPMGLNHIIKKKTITTYGALPNKLIMPCSVCDISYCKSDIAYILPLEGSSWISYDTMFYNFWLCHWKEAVFAIFILLITFFALVIVRCFRWGAIGYGIVIFLAVIALVSAVARERQHVKKNYFELLSDTKSKSEKDLNELFDSLKANIIKSQLNQSN